MNIKIYKLELYVHILHCGDSPIMIMCVVVCVSVCVGRERKKSRKISSTNTHIYTLCVNIISCSLFLFPLAHTQTHTHTVKYIHNPVDSSEHISMHTFLIFKQNTLLNICEEKESEMSPSPGANVIKLLRPYFTYVCNKLECLSMAGLSSLV
jgi:hypothetical protein